ALRARDCRARGRHDRCRTADLCTRTAVEGGRSAAARRRQWRAQGARRERRELIAMALRFTYPGACHCGNIAVRLLSDKTPSELGLRTDTCSFCTKHHSLYTSDPGGELHLAIADDSALARCRFGTKTADFLLCKTCGVFVVAYMPEPPVAVLNVTVLDAQAEF